MYIANTTDDSVTYTTQPNPIPPVTLLAGHIDKTPNINEGKQIVFTTPSGGTFISAAIASTNYLVVLVINDNGDPEARTFAMARVTRP